MEVLLHYLRKFVLFAIGAALGPSSLSAQAGTPTEKLLTATFGSLRPSVVKLEGRIALHTGANVESGSVELGLGVKGGRKVRIDLDSGRSFGEEQNSFSQGLQCRATREGITQTQITPNCWLAVPWFFPAFALISDPEIGAAPSQQSDGMLHLQRSSSLRFKEASADSQVKEWSSVDLALNTITGLPDRLNYKMHAEGRLPRFVNVEIRYSEYASEAGIQVAHHVQRYLNGTLQSDIHIEHVTIQ